MKKLILLLLLTGCVNNPKTPLKGNKVAVTIEGLGGAPYVEKAYTKTLESRGYTVYNLNRHYKQRIKADVCLVHSCGWNAVQKGADCKKLFSFDGRTCKVGESNKSFVKPEGVGEHVAFYQTKPLRGYPIKGAINKKISGTSHGGLPSKVFKQVTGEL